MKSGFVSIVGRPNVGKSTLLNSILERKIAITSDVSGTTRNIIQGIYNDDDSQIIFIDTPGIHKPQNRLGDYLNKKAYMMLEDVDLILFLVDVEKGFGKGDMFILNKIKQEKGDNLNDLIKTIKKYLKDDIKYYDDDVITNVSRDFLIAEFVREKILYLTNKEVPHTVTCMVEDYKDNGNIIDISVLIIVDRDNLKKIIIGKQGKIARFY